MKCDFELSCLCFTSYKTWRNFLTPLVRVLEVRAIGQCLQLPTMCFRSIRELSGGSTRVFINSTSYTQIELTCCTCFIKKHYTSGHLSRCLTKAYMHLLQVSGKLHKAKRQPTYKSIQKRRLILSSFDFRTSGDLATMHKDSLLGNKYSLCGVAKLCHSRTFDRVT